MKKPWLFASIFILSTCLVACTDKEDTNDVAEAPTTNTDSTSTDAKGTLLSIEEFIKHLKNAPTEFTSFATDTTITTITTTDEKEEKLPISIVTTATTEPLRMKQLLKMDLREQGFGQINSESYTQDGFMFIKHPENETWVKTAIPHFDAYAAQIMQQSPTEQIAFIKENAHLFTVHETKTAYQLSFKGDKDAVQQLLDAQFSATLQHARPITADKTFTYEALRYQIVLDKKTLFPVSLEMTTELTNAEDEKSTHTKLEMNAVYRDINAVSPIELPETAKNAETITE